MWGSWGAGSAPGPQLPPGVQGAPFMAPLGIKSGHTTIRLDDPVFFTWGKN
jgi:hypothetical protein